MLSNSRLNRSFWAEVVSIICYLVNRSPSTPIDFKAPIEVWSNKPTKYSMLKLFGCLVYYHISEGKLKPKAKKKFFMGYGDVKGF